jgi:hypothetical protein
VRYEAKRYILSLFRVRMGGIWIHNWIYWISLHRSLSHRDWCPQGRCLVAASNVGCSYASGLTSLQDADHPTPTSFSVRWLQLALPPAANLRVGATSNSQRQTPTVNIRLEDIPYYKNVQKVCHKGNSEV